MTPEEFIEDILKELEKGIEAAKEKGVKVFLPQYMEISFTIDTTNGTIVTPPKF